MKTLLLTLVLGIVVVATGCEKKEAMPPEMPATNAPAVPPAN